MIFALILLWSKVKPVAVKLQKGIFFQSVPASKPGRLGNRGMKIILTWKARVSHTDFNELRNTCFNIGPFLDGKSDS